MVAGKHQYLRRLAHSQILLIKNDLERLSPVIFIIPHKRCDLNTVSNSITLLISSGLKSAEINFVRTKMQLHLNWSKYPQTKALSEISYFIAFLEKVKSAISNPQEARENNTLLQIPKLFPSPINPDCIILLLNKYFIINISENLIQSDIIHVTTHNLNIW